jgi:hypothetical protein
MKRKVCLLSAFVIFSSFIFSQSAMKRKDNTSVFADFEQLGIKKELFIEKFGRPISKDMAYDKDSNKVEILYYKEDIGKEKTIIITEFTFKNNKLIEQKSRIETFIIDKKMIDKISNDLTFIRHRVHRLKLVP